MWPQQHIAELLTVPCLLFVVTNLQGTNAFGVANIKIVIFHLLVIHIVVRQH